MAKKEGKELTPMMKQFFDLKAKHPDAVMLFRCVVSPSPIVIMVLV